MEREEILTQYRLNPDAIVSYIEALEAGRALLVS